MRRFLFLSLGAAAIAALGSIANATEGGGSFYLPGGKAAGAGMTPPPGLFFANDFYFYEGSASAGLELPLGGEIILDADLKLIFNAASVLWITEQEILGGRLGFGLTVPFGYADLTAELGMLNFEDEITQVADPLVTALLGWDFGNFHHQASVAVNVPIGMYDTDEVLNLSRHYWGANFTWAVTWLDPQIGWDLSAALGLTFNGENPATDYRSGTEAHLDWAAVYHFNESFSAGPVGYYYQQITGDGGSGATLGDFKGRIAAIGFEVGYNFELGQLPVATNVRYYHEFAAENRVEGDAIFFSASFPLWMPPR